MFDTEHFVRKCDLALLHFTRMVEIITAALSIAGGYPCLFFLGLETALRCCSKWLPG